MRTYTFLVVWLSTLPFLAVLAVHSLAVPPHYGTLAPRRHLTARNTFICAKIVNFPSLIIETNTEDSC